MIDLKYINEAIRLAPIRLQDAQTYSDWQYALYCVDLELERFKKETHNYLTILTITPEGEKRDELHQEGL